MIAPTRKVLGTLRAYGLNNKITIIPSGISLSQHQKRLTAAERSEKRRSLGIGDDQTVLLNLGRLGTEKKLTMPIKAKWMTAASERSMKITARVDKSAFGDAIEAVYQDVLREINEMKGETHGI